MGYEIQSSRVATPHFPLSLNRNTVQYFQRPCLFQLQIQSDIFKELVETNNSSPFPSTAQAWSWSKQILLQIFFHKDSFLWNLGSVEKVCMLTGREHSSIVYSLCSFDTRARLQLRRARGAQKRDEGRTIRWFAFFLGLARSWAHIRHLMLFKNDVLIWNAILSSIRFLEESASL